MSVLRRVPSTAPRRATSLGLLFFVLCIWSLVAGLVPAAAQSDSDALREQLERVEAEQAQLAESLNSATARVDDLTARMAQIRDRGDELRSELKALEKRGARAQALVQARIRDMYKGDRSTDALTFATGGSLAEITARTHYASVLARNDQQRFEEAAALASATQARRDELAGVDARMAELIAEAEQAQSDLDSQFAAAGDSYAQLQDELAQAEAEAARLAAEAEAKRLAAEEAARTEASEEAAAQLAAAELAERRAAAASRSAERVREEVAAAPAPASPAPAPPPAPAPAPAPEPAPDPPSGGGGGSSGGGSSGGGSSGGGSSGGGSSGGGSSGGGSAPASGGKACPQANPRSFTDTWGAPRSGGRTHQGTDIFGTRGGDVFAIVSGRIEWTQTGANSGLFLSLRGNDGHQYWYMHLQDYVARPGQSVQAGQLIAHNGDTGNARGTTPHIHFEYHPGGGGPVNPYPLLKSICG